MVFFILVSIGTAFEYTIWPFLTGYFISELEKASQSQQLINVNHLGHIIIVYVAAWLILAFVNILYRYLQMKIIPELNRSIKFEVMNSILSKELDYFKTNQTGDLVNQVGLVSKSYEAIIMYISRVIVPTIFIFCITLTSFLFCKKLFLQLYFCG